MKIPWFTIGGLLIGLSIPIDSIIISSIFAGVGIFIIAFNMGRFYNEI